VIDGVGWMIHLLDERRAEEITEGERRWEALEDGKMANGD